ncbi:MAG: hypothetical protein FWD67_02785 [Betaproteobacteria bacterium]|nr:hypothetical protein [Betaproteobacteria bacterium]
MRLQKQVLTFLLSDFIATPANAFKIKPGEWEESNDGRVNKICLTPETEQEWSVLHDAAFDIDDPWIASAYKGKMTEKRSNLYKYQAECLSPFNKKISSTKFLSDMSILTESDEGQIRKKTRQRGEKISENETLQETFSKRTRVLGKQFLSLTKTTNRYKKITNNELVIHTTVQDGDRKTGWANSKIIEAYKYLWPTCTDPDEESARQEGTPSEIPPVKPDGR